MVVLGGNGRASLLLKSSSKRKRTREELEEVKLEEGALKEDKHSFLQEYKKLKIEHAQMMELLQGQALQEQLRAEQRNEDDGNDGNQQFII